MLNHRLRVGWAAFHKHKAELCCKAFRLEDRAKLFDFVVTPVVLYGCVAWALRKRAERQLVTAWRRMLRYVFRIQRRAEVGPAGPEDWVDFVRRSAHTADNTAAKLGMENWLSTHKRR